MAIAAVTIVTDDVAVAEGQVPDAAIVLVIVYVLAPDSDKSITPVVVLINVTPAGEAEKVPAVPPAHSIYPR